MEKPKPPTGLGILVDEKRVNDLLTQKSGAKAIARSGCNLALFICFIILFTVLALSEPLTDFRALEGYVRRRFDTSAAMHLDEVTSVGSFWQYIHKSFMPGIYGNDTRPYYYPDFVPDKLLQIEGANRLFGVARLRMLKVVPGQACAVKASLESFFPTCYGQYMVEAHDMDAYGPPDPVTGDPIYNFISDPTGVQVTGKVATYAAGGFMQAFTSNHNETNSALLLMENEDFLGPGTRVIFIDWTIFNFNLNCYAVCRLMFEIAPSGNWVNELQVTVLMQRHMNPIASRTTGDWLALLGEVILVLFVLRYLLEEASEFVGFRGRYPYIKWDYFSDAWNILDWLNLGLMVFTLGMRISTWGLAGNLQVYIGDPAKQSIATFSDLSGVATNVRLIHSVLAFNTVLTWFKAVKYIAILPYITTFMQTVSMSQRALSSFVAVFFALLFGFVLAYSVAFGEQVPQFRTPWMTFVFLTSSFLGNADMNLVYEQAPLLGTVLIMLFVLAMFFVSVNLFYSIMISALADVKKEEEKGAAKWDQTKEKMKDFWSTISESLRLEYRFKKGLPGLYSRLKRWKKSIEEKENERDEELRKREAQKKQAAAVALGPGNPSLGRRKKPAANTLSIDDVESESDNGSDVDLGPLVDKAQLTKQGMFGDVLADGDFGVPMLQDEMDEGQASAQSIQLCIKATRHVVDGIVDRTYGARGVLMAEMAESKDVLFRVGSVLEVLSKRANDLVAQQQQLLKHF
mmetsp:Transcript_48298/g.121644  ORF Transcript_48298/g.121644 Transcript_48298/m.121644 type:complete len:742 (+) Transcript_48298:80-2305(+)